MMQGFQSPNYTQVPNDLFEMLRDMQDTELKVVLAIARLTFGYHRSQAVCSVAKLAKMTGLSRAGVLTGAGAAEKRGILKRLNPDSITSAEWEMIVRDELPLQPVEGVEPEPLQPVEGDPPASRGQVRLNKYKEKGGNNTLSENLSLDWLIQAGASQEEVEALANREKFHRNIVETYETKMGYNPLPWSDPKLSRLLKFLLTKTPEEIETFASWSRQEYSPLSPAKARQFPNLVIECWPQAFEKKPKKPRAKPVSADA